MAYGRKHASFDWLALWILFSAWASLSGWCLSLSGYLNLTAIVSSYLLLAGGVVFFRSHLRCASGLNAGRMLRSRFWAPKIWLALTVLALIGGSIHTPNNYDYLSYRFPRVLDWTWEHQWHWIPTLNERINYSATGFEWLMVPLFVVFKTDRLFFLINFISYLFLPGLVFFVFSKLGISKRICWWWMWVFPCGYCYILQTASTGNDSFAAVYLLASLSYLYQEQGVPSVKNLALSSLAIALMTGAKASNLPLVLPWLVVVFLRRKYLFEKCRPAIFATIMLACAVISFLPVALLNILFTGDFAGDPNNLEKMKVSHPVIGFLGNSFELVKDNLAPPLFPRPIDWNQFVPAFLAPILQQDFPRLYLHSGELQMEEAAGVGLGIVVFAGVFLVVGIQARSGKRNLIKAPSNQALPVVLAGVIAWLVYMTKMGSEATSRLITGYYPLLIAGVLVLVSLDGRVMHRRVFRWAGHFAMLSAIPLVILSPSRPLFPVQAVANLMTAIHLPPGLITRYNEVYSVYAGRSFEFEEMLAALPPGERTIGLLQDVSDSQVSLWRPFGARNVVEVSPVDSREAMTSLGIHFVFINQDALTHRLHTTLDSLLAKWSAKVVEEKKIKLMAHVGAETWYLVSL